MFRRVTEIVHSTVSLSHKTSNINDRVDSHFYQLLHYTCPIKQNVEKHDQHPQRHLEACSNSAITLPINTRGVIEETQRIPHLENIVLSLVFAILSKFLPLYFTQLVHSCFSRLVRIFSFGSILVQHKSVICFTLSWNKDYIEKVLFVISLQVLYCFVFDYLSVTVFQSKTKLSYSVSNCFYKPLLIV